MKLVDVNVLVYAHRADTLHHKVCHRFLYDLINSDEAYGMAELVLSGFLRVVTHPRIFNPPTPTERALEFVRAVRSRANHVAVSAGARHFEIFLRLVEQSGARGNLIPDAYLAALAIESGSEWVTTDMDYSRFKGLNWYNPVMDRRSS
ncbi:MAG: type II toxin-antitoxin system VapC family toxin [Deltaproteobacteria bacterium]|nr:MAG: type II toxin-antitoxin system VapC family toxin [Deltaproteobacteria bacterium]